MGPVLHAQTMVEPSEDLKSNVAASVAEQAEVTPAVQDTLDAVMERVKSVEWAAEQNRLKREVAVLTGNMPAEPIEDEDPEYEAQDRLVIFVSSSMPLSTLRNYAQDLDAVNGLLVLRGMVDGMKTMGPTLSLISRVLRIDAACQGANCPMRTTNVVIDPMLFRENGITQVPAAVFVENMPLEPYCERFDDGSMPSKARFVVYGDVSAKHMATELLRMSNSQPLQRLIKEM